jgi:GrpB-like predicted nucleotidyltransferase (UPF0157 family)
LEHLVFRNHLRAHPQVAAQYEALKRELAHTHDANTPQSMEAYSLAKSEFVANVLRAEEAGGAAAAAASAPKC